MRCIGIVGPTGVGKSRLALEVALATGAEIVNADSRQVYRRLDVGTDKPSLDDRALAPHHLYDVVEPDEPFTLAIYLDAARAVLAGIAARGRPALIVGGTGLYVRALQRGYAPPGVPPDQVLRRSLDALSVDELVRLLEAQDPLAVARVDRRNPRRLVRAIEVAMAGAKPEPAEAGRVPQFPLVGLTLPRAELFRRIDDRAALMWKSGWLDEVRKLLAAAYAPGLPALSALGYPEVIACVRGETGPGEALHRIQFAGHRLARRQYAWFKPSDPGIAWFDASTPKGWSGARRFVGACLSRCDVRADLLD